MATITIIRRQYTNNAENRFAQVFLEVMNLNIDQDDAMAMIDALMENHNITWREDGGREIFDSESNTVAMADNKNGCFFKLVSDTMDFSQVK